MRILSLCTLLIILISGLFVNESKANNYFNSHKEDEYFFTDSTKRNIFATLNSYNRGVFLREEAEHLLNIDSAVKSMQVIILSSKEFEKTDNNSEIGINLLFIGKILEQSNLLKLAEQRYLKAIQLLNFTDSLNMVRTYSALARVNDKIGNYELTSRYIHKAEQLLNRNKDLKERARLFNFKAIVHARANYFDKALAFADSALFINSKLQDSVRIAVNYNNKGKIYFMQSNYNMAYTFFKLSFDIDKKLNSGNISVTKAVNMAAVYNKLGDPYKAVSIYEQINPDNLDYNDSRVMSIYYYNLYSLYLKQAVNIKRSGYIDSTLYYCKRAKNFHQVSSLYLNIANKAYQNNNIDGLYRNLVLYKHYSDSTHINNTNNFIHDAYIKESLKELNSDTIKKIPDNIYKNIWLYETILFALITLSFIIAYIINIKKRENLLIAKEKEIECLSKKLTVSKDKVAFAYNYSEQMQQTHHQLISRIKNLEELNTDYLHQIKHSKKDEDKALYLKHLNSLDKYFKDISNQHNNIEENFVKLRTRIKTHFPDLTKNEEEFCFLLKLNYSVKEIASKMNISTRSAEVAKYRLRKKVGFESMEKFMGYLKDI